VTSSRERIPLAIGSFGVRDRGGIAATDSETRTTPAPKAGERGNDGDTRGMAALAAATVEPSI
jgi:hypothetical protein